MHQLMTLEAIVVANDKTEAADAGSPGGMWLPRCFPPVPSIVMNAIKLGNHATVSYLEGGGTHEKDTVRSSPENLVPMNDTVTEECNL